MAQFGFVFDVADLPEREQQSFDPIPAGWYTATIGAVDIRDTKSGGQMFNIRYNITGPAHSGRVIYGNINVANSNPKAVEIGMEQLGQILRSIGMQKLVDTDELIGHDLQVKVEIRQSVGYPDANEVRGWRPSASSVPKTDFTDLETDFAPKKVADKKIPPWAAR